MDPATIVSTVGIFASPALQVALDRLVSYLSEDQPSHSAFDDVLERLRLSMSNIPALARAAENTPLPDAGLLDLLRQLKDASDSANDLLDDLQYHSIHLQAQSYTPLSISSPTFESQPSRARSAPVRDAVVGDSGQGSVIAPVNSPLSLALDAIRALSWGKAVQALSGGSSAQIPADRSGAAASLPDPNSSNSTTISSTSIASSSQATQPPVPTQILLPGASEHSSSSSQPKTGLLQQQAITYQRTVGERIIKMAEKLELIASRLEKSISLEKLTSDLIGRSEGQNHHLSSSVVIQQEVFGRDFEREMLVNKLLESEHLERLSVLPVLGIGGVGKTTLAQYVFNDKRIEEHFEPRVWICVSYHFDRLMIMRELVAYTSPSEEKYIFEGIGLDGLERKLKENLEGKRFLLVLDDLWTDEWVKLLPALQSSDSGSKIVITAREEKIVDRRVRRNKFVLKGLRSDDYLVFFKKCAFGDDNAEKQHPKLLSIGKQIAEKLQGSPLAAKTMGRLLSENLNDQHWTSILKSNVWELGEGAGDIMPVLKLSYMHLPRHLQRCFAYCSIFPKDYRYDVDKLVQIWIAQGLILMSTHSGRKRPEDMGREYFDDLLSRSFFEQHSSVYWSSKATYYVMHSLLHDLANSVSMGECFVYDGRESGMIPRTVRHMSMRRLPELQSVFACKNLHSLLLFLPMPKSYFDIMKSLRVLDLSDVAIDVLPDAVGELKHLRYLDLSRTPLKVLPESLCLLYHLQTLILPYACTLPRGTANLINLRHLSASGEALSTVTDVGRLTSLQELREFHVKLSRGHDIGQLKNMRELGGQLRLLNLENIRSKEEALKANLTDKERLNKLQLQWNDLEDGNNWSTVQERILGGLEPHANLKVLEIKGYMGRHSPHWLVKSSLENLQSISLIECSRWQRLPHLSQLPFLQVLYMQGMDATLEGSTEALEFFPSLKELWLENTSIIFQCTRSYSYFPKLRKLHIRSCREVSCLPLGMLTSLKELNISGCSDLDRELPGCLKGLKSLITLHLSQQGIKHLPLEVMCTLTSLQKLRLKHCPELTSVQGLQGLVSLKHLEILSCPKLSSWMPNGEEIILPERLHSLQINHCGSLSSLPVLPVGLHSLEITNCRSFEAWGTKPAELPLLGQLQKIVIEGCPKFPRQAKDGRISRRGCWSNN